MPTPKIHLHARRLARDRKRVLQELAEIVVRTSDINLTETDIRRLQLKRVTLGQLYEYQTEAIKEQQKAELIERVSAVESLWVHAVEDVSERESFAPEFGDTSRGTTH